MKRFILVLVGALLFFAVFFWGYRIGLSNGSEWAVQETSAVFERTNALRAGAIIVRLGGVEKLINGDRGLLCELRGEVVQLAVEWNDCKNKIACASALDGSFYSRVDDIILEYEKMKCN